MVICGCGEKGILKLVFERVSLKRVFARGVKRVYENASKRVSLARVLKRGIGSYGIGALCRFRINRVRDKAWWLMVDARICAYRVFRFIQGWVRVLCSALHNAFVGYGEIDIFKC